MITKKIFWKYFGLKCLEDDTTWTAWFSADDELICCGHKNEIPEITLDNLFNYAIPKLKNWDCLMDWIIEMIYAYSDGKLEKDFVQALYKRLCKVIKDERTD